MPVVNYHSANGRLIGETTSGVRTDYMSDALGSVTGTLNASQAVVNTYRYKPYGELLAKTGSAADPAFMWNGTTQSRRTGLTFSDQYNRARHYGTRQGQWTTVDPLWPSERAYLYCHNLPTSLVDIWGLTPIRVYFNSFIHEDEDKMNGKKISGFPGIWIKAPWNPDGMKYFKGDGRSFFAPGTARVASVGGVDSCKIGVLRSDDIIFEAAPYYASGLFGNPLQLRRDRKPASIKKRVLGNICDPVTGYAASVIVLEYSALNPLLPLNPLAIHVINKVTLVREGDGAVKVNMEGAHTQYPWHESSVRIGGRLQRVYTYSATPGNLVEGLMGTAAFSVPSVYGDGEKCPCPCE